MLNTLLFLLMLSIPFIFLALVMLLLCGSAWLAHIRGKRGE